MTWGKLLQDALREEPDQVPKEWKTAKQIAAEIGKSLQHTGAILNKTVRLGVVEHRKFRIRTETGRVIPIPHYKPCCKKAK